MLSEEEAKMIIVAISNMMTYKAAGNVLDEEQYLYLCSCMDLMKTNNAFKTSMINFKKAEVENAIKAYQQKQVSQPNEVDEDEVDEDDQ